MATFRANKVPGNFYPEQQTGMRLVWHGRLAETGGPLRFISIASQLPGSPARMCGEGPQRSEVLGQLARLGHPEWYTGPLTKGGVAALLGDAECGIYPLRAMAGIPRVLLESMASGLVTLTWETGACRELITDGQDGYICQDETAMLEILRQLMRDPALVRSIRMEARDTILKSWTSEFTLRVFAKKLERLMAR